MFPSKTINLLTKQRLKRKINLHGLNHRQNVKISFMTFFYVFASIKESNDIIFPNENEFKLYFLIIFYIRVKLYL